MGLKCAVCDHDISRHPFHKPTGMCMCRVNDCGCVSFLPRRKRLNLKALARETVELLLANDGFAYAERIPAEFEAVVLSAFRRVRKSV